MSPSFPVVVSSKARHVNTGGDISPSRHASVNPLGAVFPWLPPPLRIRLWVTPNATATRDAPHYHAPFGMPYSLARLLWPSGSISLEIFKLVQTCVSDSLHTMRWTGSPPHGDPMACDSKIDDLGCGLGEETSGINTPSDLLLQTVLSDLRILPFVPRPRIFYGSGVVERSCVLSHFLVAGVISNHGEGILPLDLLIGGPEGISAANFLLARGVGVVPVTQVECTGRPPMEQSWSRSTEVSIVFTRDPPHDSHSRPINRVFHISNTVESASPPFQDRYPLRHSSSEPTGDLVDGSSTTVRCPSIARLLGGSGRLPTTQPFVGVVALCFVARLHPAKLRSVLAVRATYGSTFAWGPNAYSGSFGLDHTSNSNQVPSMQQEGAAQRDTSGWSRQDPSASQPALPSDTQVPQHHYLLPERPTPTGAYGRQNSGPRYPIALGTTIRDTRMQHTLIPDYDGSYRHSALAPPAPGNQQPNAPLPQNPVNLYQNASGGPHLLPSIPRHPTILHSTVAPPQNFHPWDPAVTFGRQVEVFGSGTASSSTTTAHAFDAEQATQTWQLPVEEVHQTLNDFFPAHATNHLEISAPVTTSQPTLAHVPPEPDQVSEARQRLHACSVCSRSFRRPYLLKDHMASRHNQQGEGGSYPCDYPGCDSSYASRSNLKRHAAQKHPAPDSPHPQSSNWIEYSVRLTGLEMMNSQDPSPVQRPTKVSAPLTGVSALTQNTRAEGPIPGPSIPSTVDLAYAENLLVDAELGNGARKFARVLRR